MKKHKYKILHFNCRDYYGNFIDEYYDKAVELIEQHLDDGWILNGAPFVNSWGEGQSAMKFGKLCQSMYKVEDVDDVEIV